MGTKRKASAGPDADLPGGDAPEAPVLTGNAYLDASRARDYERQRIDRVHAGGHVVESGAAPPEESTSAGSGAAGNGAGKKKRKGKGWTKKPANKGKGKAPASDSGKSASVGHARRKSKPESEDGRPKAPRGWLYITDSESEDDAAAVEESMEQSDSRAATPEDEDDEAAEGAVDETFVIDAIIRATYLRTPTDDGSKIGWRYTIKWFNYTEEETAHEGGISWASFNMDENNHAIRFWQELRKRGEVASLPEPEKARAEAEWKEIKEAKRREDEMADHGGRDAKGRKVKKRTEQEWDEWWLELRDMVEPKKPKLGTVHEAPIRCTHKWYREALINYQEQEVKDKTARDQAIALGQTEAADKLTESLVKTARFIRDYTKKIEQLNGQIEKLGLKPLALKSDSGDLEKKDKKRKRDEQAEVATHSGKVPTPHAAVAPRANATAGTSGQASTSSAKPTEPALPLPIPEGATSAEAVKLHPRSFRVAKPVLEAPKKRRKKHYSNAELFRDPVPDKPLRPIVRAAVQERRGAEAQADQQAFLPIMSMEDIHAQATAQAAAARNAPPVVVYRVSQPHRESLFGTASESEDPPAPQLPAASAEAGPSKIRTHQPKWTGLSVATAGGNQAKEDPGTAEGRAAAPLFSPLEQKSSAVAPGPIGDLPSKRNGVQPDSAIESIRPAASAMPTIHFHSSDPVVAPDPSRPALSNFVDLRSPPSEPPANLTATGLEGEQARKNTKHSEASIGTAKSPIEVITSPKEASVSAKAVPVSATVQPAKHDARAAAGSASTEAARRIHPQPARIPDIKPKPGRASADVPDVYVSQRPHGTQSVLPSVAAGGGLPKASLAAPVAVKEAPSSASTVKPPQGSAATQQTSRDHDNVSHAQLQTPLARGARGSGSTIATGGPSRCSAGAAAPDATLQGPQIKASLGSLNGKSSILPSGYQPGQIPAEPTLPPPPPPPDAPPPPLPPPALPRHDVHDTIIKNGPAVSQHSVSALRDCFSELAGQSICVWDPPNSSLYCRALGTLGLQSRGVVGAKVIITQSDWLTDIDQHASLRRCLDNGARFVTVAEGEAGRPCLKMLMVGATNVVTFAPLFMLKEPELFKRIIQALQYSPYWKIVIQPQVLHHVATMMIAPPCAQPGSLLMTLIQATRSGVLTIKPNVMVPDGETLEEAIARDTIGTSRDWNELVKACAAFPVVPMPSGYLATTAWHDATKSSLEFAQMTEFACLWERVDIEAFRGVYYVGSDCSILLGLPLAAPAGQTFAQGVKLTTAEDFLRLSENPRAFL